MITTWRRVALVVLGLVVGGWMVFDGTRAFLLGDYVTPSTGIHAGQLGPWSKVIGVAGIDPRSAFAKALHILSGLLWVGAIGSLARGRRATPRWPVAVAAAASLWYLPMGTLGGVVALLLLLTERRKVRSAVGGPTPDST